MSEQIISKQCRTCKEIKPISEFCKHPKTKDGHQTNCKICQRASKKRYRESEKGKTTEKRYDQSETHKAIKKRYAQSEKGKIAIKRYNKSEKGRKTRTYNLKKFNIRHPEHLMAMNAVNNAIRDDHLPRPDSLQCHYCPKQAKEYHHHKGYAPEHWLDVVPVCIKCHNEIPKK